MDPVNVILCGIVISILGVGWSLFSKKIPWLAVCVASVLSVGLYLSATDYQIPKTSWGSTTPGGMVPYDQTQVTDAFDASTAQAQKYLAENSMPTMMPYQPAGSGYIPTGEPAEAAAKAVSDAVKKWGVTPGQIKAMSGPKHHQPDAKTVAEKWPMKPPEIVPLSEWSAPLSGGQFNQSLGSYRWVAVDGCRGLQSLTAHTVSFLPETTPATPMTPAEPKEEKP